MVNNSTMESQNNTKEIYHVSPLAYRKGEESEEEGDGEEAD